MQTLPPVYKTLYNTLDTEEKVVFVLKGYRKYYDDLDLATKQLAWENIKTLEAIAAKLESLTKELTSDLH